MTLLSLLRPGDPGPPTEPEPSYVAVSLVARPSWDEAIRAPHVLAVRATLLVNGLPTDDIIPIRDGSVTLDANAAVRGRCDVSIAFDRELGMVPDTPTSLLAPYGNEIKLERGIEYVDGSRELVSLGVFRLQEVDVDDDGAEPSVQISGLDRAQRFIEARFEASGQIDAAQLVAAGMPDGTLPNAILFLLQQAWPDVSYDFTTSTVDTAPVIYEEGGDRWALAQEMAKSIGMELFFDGDGVCVLRPIVQAGGSVAMVLAEGEDSVLLGVGRRWTREGTYNRYIVTGENTGTDDPSARGVATDDNPLSPTYYYGQFGKTPGWYSSPFITTDGQAANAAQGMLAKQLGTTETVSFGMIVNPKLAPGDVVRITRARAGIDEDHVVDQLTIPLAAEGVMTGTTRAVQVYS